MTGKWNLAVVPRLLEMSFTDRMLECTRACYFEGNVHNNFGTTLRNPRRLPLASRQNSGAWIPWQIMSIPMLYLRMRAIPYEEIHYEAIHHGSLMESYGVTTLGETKTIGYTLELFSVSLLLVLVV